MKCIVVYDSTYGNTEKIAGAISTALDSCTVVKAEEAAADMLYGKDVMIIGSPTHGGRPSENILKFVDKIPAGKYPNLRAAVFDTRVKYEEQNFALKILLRIIGYAASKLARKLSSSGIKVIGQEAGFYVNGKEGPLSPGELERAVKWAKIATKQ